MAWMFVCTPVDKGIQRMAVVIALEGGVELCHWWKHLGEVAGGQGKGAVS